MSLLADIPEGVEARPERLTQIVLQIGDMLGLYRAEVARILGLLCGDLGRLGAARESLCPGTEPWKEAVLFVRFYRTLYGRFAGDETAIAHWLRRHDAALGGTPLLLIVDEGRLAQVLDHLEARGPEAATEGG